MTVKTRLRLSGLYGLIKRKPDPVNELCHEHPGCAIVTCAAFSCKRPVHLLPRRGRPRRYCSDACRKAEYKRLR